LSSDDDSSTSRRVCDGVFRKHGVRIRADAVLPFCPALFPVQIMIGFAQVELLDSLGSPVGALHIDVSMSQLSEIFDVVEPRTLAKSMGAFHHLLFLREGDRHQIAGAKSLLLFWEFRGSPCEEKAHFQGLFHFPQSANKSGAARRRVHWFQSAWLGAA
jgi:hypothetical protein